MKIFNLKIFDWLLPNRCVCCGGFSHSPISLCLACSQELPWLQNFCRQCAMPLPIAVNHCGACLKKPPWFDKTIALFFYQAPIERFIIELKFNKKLIYAKLLGTLMVEYLKNQHTLPECIIPVPLHRKRLQERGYNQALEIARPLAKQLKIPLLTTACRRIKPTSAQLHLPASARRRNVKGAFRVDEGFSFKHVAIVDDVVTTASTVAELSKILKQAGVQMIEVWCCARVHLNC